MSHNQYLLPNINPAKNTNLKGDVLITGTLHVTDDTTLQTDLTVGVDATIGGTLTVAGSSQLNGALTVTDEITVDELTVSGATQLPAGTLVGTASPNLITFGGEVPTIQTPGTIAYFTAPRAGTIVGIAACTQLAITTGDATLTAAINGVAITTGVITLPLIGTADGDPAYVIPTGANIFVLDDIISITVGGTNATATSANVTFTLQYI